MLLLPLLLLQQFASVVFTAEELNGWKSIDFPDLRGPTVSACGDHLPKDSGYPPYICDPDKVLNHTEIARINKRLHKLARDTPCKCQRRSQCLSEDARGETFQVGFMVSVAIVKKLQMTIHEADDKAIAERALSFCRSLQGRWALGDCGNAAIILVWQAKKRIFISASRLTQKFLTEKEQAVILAQVQGFIDRNNYEGALLHVLENVENELRGDEDKPFPTGTWSLIIAIGVAVFLVTLITCCVCAFRCCGNLRAPTERRSRVGKAVHRVDSLRAEVVRRGSQLRRSFSRSPKFSHHPTTTAPTTATMDDQQTRVLLGYYRDADTTMV